VSRLRRVLEERVYELPGGHSAVGLPLREIEKRAIQLALRRRIKRFGITVAV